MVLSLFLFVVIIQLSRSTDTNSSFIVSEGHWRISLASESELRCPYGTSSCTGGELAGDFLCADSFSGLLCGNAVQNYYVDWVAQDSLQCSNFFVASSVFFPAVVVLAILIFVCSYVGQTQQVRSLRHLSLTQTTESISSANSRSKNLNLPMIRRNGASADNCISFLHKLKILVFATQVTSSLPSILRTSSFGVYFAGLARVLSLLSLSSLQALPWDCYAGSNLFRFSQSSGGDSGNGGNSASPRLSYPPNYLEQMEIASVLPLIGVFIAAIVYFLHMEILQMISPVPPAEAPERAADPISEEHRSNSVLSRYTKKYGTALWILWYIACGGIWQLLAGVLANGCINADTDGVFPQTDYHVMLRDVNVFCGRSSHHVGYLWALVAAAVYIALIPALQFLLVYHYSDVIKEAHLPEILPNSATTAPSSLCAALCKYDGTPCDSENDCDSDGDSGNSSDVASSSAMCSSSSVGGDRTREICAGDDDDCGDTRSVRHSGSYDNGSSITTADGQQVPKNSMNGSKGGKKSKDASKTIPFGVLLRERDTLVYFGGVALLLQAFKPEYYWWEGVDTIMRLSYLAALPSMFPYQNPMQLLVAIATTLVFLKVLTYCKPYARAEDQMLTQCSITQILLLLLCAVAYELDLPEVRLGHALVLDLVMSLAALATPLLFLYQTFWRPCYEFLLKQDAEPDEQHTLHSLAALTGGSDDSTASLHAESAVISRSRRHRHRRRTSARDRDDIKCTTNTSSSQSRPAEAVLHRPAPATLPGSPRAHQPRTSADNHVCVPSHRSTVPGVLATPPRSPDDNRRYRTGTGVAPQQDRQGSAIPLSFTYHRDLATCTQETVSYEQLSTEKRKKRQQARPRQGRRSDLSGGGSESYDEHSGSDNSASSESSASSAEYKYGGDLSTDSGNEDSFPRYPVADVPQYRASGAGQRRQQRTFRSTPLFPPSPQSTPPSSDNEEPLSSPALYQRNGRQEMNRTRPLPLNLNLNDLAPLRVHGQLRSPRAPPPPQMPQSPRVQRTAGGRHNHFHHPVSDIADWEDPAVATTEYGAQLDYLAEYPTSPAMRRPPRASTSRGVAAQHSHHRYPQHNQRSGTSISMLYPTAAAGEDAPTAEYGADLNFSCPTSPAMAAPPRPPEGSAATRSPRAPSTTNTPSTTASHGNSAIALGASPLVDYSPTTGIYPDHVQDHSFEGDVSYFREWSRKGSEESATGPHSWDYSSDREGEGGGDSFLSDRQLAPDEDIRMYNLHGGVGRSLLFDGDLELTEQTQLPLPTAPARRFLLLPPPIITTPGGIESVANFGVAEPVEKDNGEGKGEERARKRANMEDLPESIVTIFSNRRNARSASALHDTPRDIVAGAGGSRGGGLLSTVRDFGLRIMTGSNTGRCSLRISEQEN